MTPSKTLQANIDSLSYLFNMMNLIYVVHPKDLLVMDTIFESIVPLIRELNKVNEPKEEEMKLLAGQIEHQKKLLQSYILKLQEKEAANEKGHAIKEAHERIAQIEAKLNEMKAQFDAKTQEFEEMRKEVVEFELSLDHLEFLQTQFTTLLNTDLLDKDRRAKGINGYNSIKNVLEVAKVLQIDTI